MAKTGSKSRCVRLGVASCLALLTLAGAAFGQALSNSTFLPAAGTENSIFHYFTTWTWGLDIYPWAGTFVRLHGPEEVMVGEFKQVVAAPAATTVTVPGTVPGSCNAQGLTLPIELIDVAGVWLSQDRSGTNYYADSTGKGSFDPATGTITLKTPLPANLPVGNTVWVQYQLSNSTLKFRLPAKPLIGCSNEYEVYRAAGYDFAPVRKEPTGPTGAGTCGDPLAVDQQPAGRLTNQGSGPDQNGWYKLPLPNPAYDCVGEIERFVPITGAAAGGTSFQVNYTAPGAPSPDVVLTVLGVYDNPGATGTEYMNTVTAPQTAAGAFDPCTGTVTLGTALPSPLPDAQGRVWVLYTYNKPIQYDINDESVVLRMGAYRVVEDNIPVDPYGDGQTFYPRATPIVGVTGVFDQNGTDYYNPGGFISTTDNYHDTIKLPAPLPTSVKSVKLIYWVGPVTLTGPTTGFSYTEGTPPGPTYSTSIPLVAGMKEAPNTSPAGGTIYTVSGARGLDMLNDPHSVPGLWQLTAPGSPAIGNMSWSANYIQQQNGGDQLISDATATIDVPYGVGKVLSIGRYLTGNSSLNTQPVPTVAPSDSWTPYDSVMGVVPPGLFEASRVESVGARGYDQVVVSPAYDPSQPLATPTFIAGVRGVWDNPNLTGTNYYTGGSFDIASNTIRLGTRLPAADQMVWVDYAYFVPHSRFGAGSVKTPSFLGADWLYDYPEIPINNLTPELAANQTPPSPANPNPTPIYITVKQRYQPVIAEAYSQDLPSGTVSRLDWRQFVPFNQSSPNDGNSSNIFAFRTRYYNWANIPPTPWLPIADGAAPSSGVVLFMKYDGQRDYRAYDMAIENPNSTTYSQLNDNTEYGVGYMFKFIPDDGFFVFSTDPTKPGASYYWPLPNHYIAMPVGMHSYFFAESDDVLKNRANNGIYGGDNAIPAMNVQQSAASDFYQSFAWTQDNPPTYKVGQPLFDPLLDDYISTTRDDPFNFADIHTMLPGVEPQPITNPAAPAPPQMWNEFNSVTGKAYNWPATSHPIVYALLSGIPFGQTTPTHIGSGWFLGTLAPYKRAVNPVFKYPHSEAGDGKIGSGPMAETYAETAGGTTSTVFTFQVMYQAFDPITKIGTPPLYMKVFVNNTSDATGAYTGYSMQPAKTSPSLQDYHDGLLYTTSLTLPAGPHTYYFQADAGHGPVRFPVRPDGMELDAPPNGAELWLVDRYVPGDANGANNDYCPGPYVNHAPVLSGQSVTPASGPLGTTFVFNVTYTDADGQRPSKTNLVIDNGTAGQIVVSMQKVDASSNTYATGVQYQYSLSSVQAASLLPGSHQYRFIFADDWGSPDDLSDVVPGETVYYPAQTGAGVVNWFPGPTVSPLARPLLSNGSVFSADGSANPNTNWTWQVTYTNGNNLPPTAISVYIGSQRQAADPLNAIPLQRITPLSATTVRLLSVPVISVTGVWTNSDGSGVNYYTGGSFDASTGIVTLGTPLPAPSRDVWVTYAANPISWDAGDPMSQRDPTDTVYTDGAVYQYQSTLPGPQNPSALPVNYYYSFQATDGVFDTVYDPVNSPSAFALMLQPDGSGSGESLPISASTGGLGVTYTAAHFPIVGPLPLTALGNPGVLVEPKITRNGTLLNRESSGVLQPGNAAIISISTDGYYITVDPTVVSGVTGIWDNADQVGTDYYNQGSGTNGQGSGGTYNPATGVIALGTQLPAGVRSVYIGYYSKGDYRIDFVNGKITFTTPNLSTDNVQMQYWWAGAGPTVFANGIPTLTNGQFTPHSTTGGVDGTSTTQFTFSVVYTDTDGQTGEPPTFIQVVIDGQPFAMTISGTGTPIYRNGVTYTYTTTLSGGTHQYYFQASDGSGFALFDNNGSQNSATQITQVAPISGPYVNDPPVLSNGLVNPNPSGGISPGTGVTYSVTYSDVDGDAPNVGTPIVWVDNPNETVYTGRVSSISGGTLVISGVNWTPNALTGLLLQDTRGLIIDPQSGTQLSTGPASGKVYQVLSNTAANVTIAVNDAVAEGIQVGDTVSIGALVMSAQNSSQTSFRPPGVTFQVVVASMPVGSHVFHFTASSAPTNTIVRFPATGDLTGPVVNNTPPAGNAAPVLTGGSVNPAVGLPATPFTFQVSYSDADGDPATAHDGVFGYVKLVFDDGSYPSQLMTPATLPVTSWVTPVLHQITLTGLPSGTHAFHFEGSDGYRFGNLVARYPASAASDPSILVRSKPVLSIGTGQGVSPSNGSTSTTFTYTVTYTSADNNPGSVYVVIDGGTPIQMAQTVSSAQNYTQGVQYEYQAVPGALALGTHNYYFTASDAYQSADPTPTQSGPIVQNLPGPTLTADTPPVTPATGPASTPFVYSVLYKDPSGLPAASITVNIDSTPARAMTQDLTYGTGVNHTDSQGRMRYVSGPITLAAGTHVYYFAASNGQVSTRLPSGTGTFSGPSVSGANLTLTVTPSPANLGDTLAVSGSLAPASVNPATITVTAAKPDGSNVTQTLTTNSSGNFSSSNFEIADQSGTWTVTAAWAGGGGFSQQSVQQVVNVGGLPIQVTAGQIDMIGLTLIPSPPGDPGVVFGGADVATSLRLAMWDPALVRYLMYPADSPTFTLGGGAGFWIYPQTTTTVTAVGQLWPQTTAYPIPLSTGWNQIGSVFVRSINLADAQVTYQGLTLSLTAAATQGWIRDYAWGFNPATGQYFLVQKGQPYSTLDPGRGYWIRALVDCTLVLSPPPPIDQPPPAP